MSNQKNKPNKQNLLKHYASLISEIGKEEANLLINEMILDYTSNRDKEIGKTEKSLLLLFQALIRNV